MGYSDIPGTAKREFSTATSEELATVVMRAQAFTSATGAAIALTEGEEMVCRASSGTTAPDVGVHLSIEGSFTGLAVTSGQALRCDDSESDSRVDAAACRIMRTRAMCVVPVRDQGSVAGVLAVFSTNANAFSDYHMAVLKTMADLISQSLERARGRQSGDGVPTPAKPVAAPPPPPPPPKTVAPPPPPPPPPKPVAPPPPPPKVVAPPPPPPPPKVVAPPPPPPPPKVVAPPPPPPKAVPPPPVAKKPDAAPAAAAPAPAKIPTPAPSRPKFEAPAPVAKVPTPVPVKEERPKEKEKKEERFTPVPVAKREKPAPVSVPTFGGERGSVFAAEEAPKEPAKSNTLLIVGGIVGVAVVVFAVWFFGFRTPAHSEATNKPAAPATTPAATAPAPSTTTPAATTEAAKPGATAPPQPAAADQSKNQKPAQQPPAQAEQPPQPKNQPAPVMVANEPSSTRPSMPSQDVAAPKLTPAAGGPGLPTLASGTPNMPTLRQVIVPPQLLKRVNPMYPIAAKQMNLKGAVLMEIKINAKGDVTDVRPISGNSFFYDAAKQAIRQWKYKPQTVNGTPTESALTVSVNFQ